MAKKSILFIAMVLVSIVAILSFVGRAHVSRKKEHEKKNIEIVISKERKEIKIVAIKEKTIPLNKKPQKVKKKKELIQAEKKLSKKKNPAMTDNSINKAQATKSSIEKVKKEYLGPKKLYSASLRINQNMIEDGRTLIDKKVTVPIIQASYDRIGFDSYLKQMKDMGGRLFVGDALEQKILAEAIVDYHHGTYSFGIDEGINNKLDGMALFRPREIVSEALVDEMLEFVRKTHGDKDLRCVILLPLDKEAAILGAHKEYFKNSGYDISQFDMVWGHYFKDDWGFGLKMEKGRMSRTQEIIQLDMILTMN